MRKSVRIRKYFFYQFGKNKTIKTKNFGFHCQQQQSYSGVRSPGRSNATYLLLLTYPML